VLEVTIMRGSISFLIGLLTMAAIVALGFIAAQNPQGAQLTVLGNRLQVEQGWTVVGAAALGFLLGFLVLIPGRLASALRSGSLSRQGRRLEERLRGLREEHAQLQGSHQRLLDEHQRVLGQVLAPVAAGPAPARPATLAMPAATGGAVPRTGPILPQRRAEGPGGAAQSARRPAAPSPSPSPVERARRGVAARWARVRAWFRRRRRGTDRPSSPDTPIEATA